ncbi:MAG: hypothetical protein FWC80_01360 [Firmicutes bacterium]|nr:hypothetical protein [Bacillota bacterium]
MKDNLDITLEALDEVMKFDNLKTVERIIEPLIKNQRPFRLTVRYMPKYPTCGATKGIEHSE